jgi:ribosomal-protein-alanine N-acetyltransferase
MSQDFLLQTERLQMRRLTLDDAELMLAVWNDADFIRNVADRGIRTVEQAQDAMRSGALHLYDTYDYGPYRAALREDDTAIGICGLFHRDSLDDPDIGYAVLPDFRGKGLAFEAAEAVIRHARVDLTLERLIALISPGNAASIGLIEKLGLVFEKMHCMPDDDEEIRVYGMQFNDGAISV